MRPFHLRLSRFELLAWSLALACGVAPLWAGGLPLVDLPQHLHLISVLHRLSDPTTLFPETFGIRPVVTPYLGVYYCVSLLNWLVPLQTAMRLFLTAYVAGLPLALAFLLRSLRRPAWPALLAIPFAYGDSFAWGFLNYCSALPLTFLSLGLFVRTLEDPARRRTWAIAQAVTLCGVLLFHVQAFAYLAAALPLLLLSTRAPEDAQRTLPWASHLWKSRRAALLSVVPGVALFAVWVGSRFGEPQEIAYGQPWKAWGPMLSPQNLAWHSAQDNQHNLVPLLGNLLADGADMRAVYLAFGLAALGVVAALVLGREALEGRLARFRIVALCALALALYFLLPADIYGYVYYLNWRFTHLFAALAVACVPALEARGRRALLALAALVGPVTAWPLARAFAAYEVEARAVESLAAYAPAKPRVMGLVYRTQSPLVTHPVHLHEAATVARLAGGLTNFSFATTPHSPLMYRGDAPPTFPSEWHPETMDWETQGRFYDTFVVAGAHPSQIPALGPHVGRDCEVAGEAGGFYLVRRRAAP